MRSALCKLSRLALPALLPFLFAVPAAQARNGSREPAVTIRVIRPTAGHAPRGGQAIGRVREPLQPELFFMLPIGAVHPRGWVRRQLELDASGITGHMEEISTYLKFEGNGWVDPKGTEGWEEMPYWLRGFGDLGYVLGDQRIIGEARRWIDGILTAQRPDGYFGPERLRTALDGGPDLWPHMLILNALQSWEEYSRDPRVLPFLLHFFRYVDSQPPAVFHKGWGAVRWGDALLTLYWLYNRTGERWLLDLGKKIHENSADYTTSIPTWHNVNIAQGIREPAQYWQQSGEAHYLGATYRDYRDVMDRYGQFPGGGFAGDENCRPGFRDPRQGFETCGIVEFMHTFELMTRITADPVWADRTEELAFNSLPAALTPDHRGTHYITCANSIQLDRSSKKHAQFANGPFPMQAFKPGVYEYRCCPHNLGIGWPYFAENMWLGTNDGGLAVSLYGPSKVAAAVPTADFAHWTEETDYPFSDTIKLRYDGRWTARFPLYLRVPGWCSKPAVSLNGSPLKAAAGPLSYIRLGRVWRPGDRVTLRLPMRLRARSWKTNKNSVSLDYGPLTYSLLFAEKWTRSGGTPSWPEYDVRPENAWNYGLVLDRRHPGRTVRITRKTGAVPSQPFTPAAVPISLHARARRIPGWQADSDGVVGVLQESPVRTGMPEETIELIPMGAARLRITAFPTVGTGPGAHEWTVSASWPRASASHVFDNDSVDAMRGGAEPASSDDQTIPRFTWWDHRGTLEWVQYDFPRTRTFRRVDVYWFDDRKTGGGCRVPASWRLLYKEGDKWTPVKTGAPFTNAMDRYNTLFFSPLSSTALRLEAQLQPGYSGGILRWKVQ